MRIAITGANGFIGNELVSYFVAKDNEVIVLQRKPPEQVLPGTTYQHFDLDEPNTFPTPDQMDALIHAAYVPFAEGNHSSQKNMHGTLALYNECLKKNVQFVFLSSMSAHADARSDYGKSKWEIENLLDKNKCLILKLGLVMGKKGLFHRIKTTVEKTSIIFLVGGGKQPIQPVFITDVCSIIEKCIKERKTGTYCVATPQVYTMKELFRSIANYQGQKLVFVPVSYFLADLAISMIELLHLPFPVSKENLEGLKQLRSFDTKADLEKLGVEVSTLQKSIGQLS